MSKVTFNGEEKRIYVNEGVTDISIESELYSEWKRWVRLDNNSKWLPAFTTTGGDPINAQETEFSPKFFYLINNWKVVVDNGKIVSFVLNLYTFNEDGEIYIIGNGSAVRATNSNATVISMNGPVGKVDVSDQSIESISDKTRQKIAQQYQGEVEIGSLDHTIDRIDKNTQK